MSGSRTGRLGCVFLPMRDLLSFALCSQPFDLTHSQCGAASKWERNSNIVVGLGPQESVCKPPPLSMGMKSPTLIRSLCRLQLRQAVACTQHMKTGVLVQAKGAQGPSNEHWWRKKNNSHVPQPTNVTF